MHEMRPSKDCTYAATSALLPSSKGSLMISKPPCFTAASIVWWACPPIPKSLIIISCIQFRKVRHCALVSSDNVHHAVMISFCVSYYWSNSNKCVQPALIADSAIGSNLMIWGN